MRCAGSSQILSSCRAARSRTFGRWLARGGIYFDFVFSLGVVRAAANQLGIDEPCVGNEDDALAEIVTDELAKRLGLVSAGTFAASGLFLPSLNKDDFMITDGCSCPLPAAAKIDVPIMNIPDATSASPEVGLSAAET